MLNPALLLFLPLVLVPILLHLITLHRLRTVELPTYRFLMDSYIQQRRKVKLLEWLIMLLRAAFVALVIFALSRPVIERVGWLGGAGGRDVVIVIDSGASMAMRSGGTTSLERAKAAASSVVEHFSRDDRVTVIAADHQPRTLISRFASAKQPFLDEIDKLESGVTAGNIAAALRQVFPDDGRKPRSVYVLTDGNRAAWQSLDQQPFARRLSASGSELFIMDVGPAEPLPNLAVIGDAPPSAAAVVGLPVQLVARVVNASDEPRDTVLSVVLDDQTVSQHNLSLQPRQTWTQTIAVTPQRPGIIRGRFEQPGDAFPDDDTYLFCLNVEDKLSVLIVRSGEPQAEHEDPALYVRAALEAPLHARAGQATAGLKDLAQAMDIHVHKPGEVKPALLANMDAVILCDVPLNKQLAQHLRAYVTAGGGLMVLPGAQVSAEQYQPLFAEQSAGLNFGAPVGDIDDVTGFRPIAGVDLKHPIFRAFVKNDANDADAYFGTTTLFRWFPIQLSTASTDDKDRSPITPLMRLPDGTVVLAEAAIGDGRVLLAGFPATPQWSNLPLKPEFVPLLLRSISHLRRSPAAQTLPAVTPHQPAVLALQNSWREARVQATDPAGRTHAVELHRDAGRVVAAMLQTQQKGYYSFDITPRTAGAPDHVELGFAVNLDAAGLQFAPLGEEGLRDLLSPAPMQYLRGSAENPMLTYETANRREIWRTLIWVTFAVIGLEFLLSTLRPRAATAGAATEHDSQRRPKRASQAASLAGKS